jgi:hypothetical protein
MVDRKSSKKMLGSMKSMGRLGSVEKDMSRAGITKRINESMRNLTKNLQDLDIGGAIEPVLPPEDFLPYCFTVCSLGRTLVLGAANHEEKERWIKSIQTRIDVLNTCLHGWLKISEGRFAKGAEGEQTQRCVLQGGNWKKCYFAILSTDIVQFKNEKLQDRIEVEFPLWSAGAPTEVMPTVEVGGNIQNFGFSIMRNGRHTYFMASDMAAKHKWIAELRNKTQALTNARSTRRAAGQVFSRQEVVQIRDQGFWVDRFLTLSGDHLHLYESSESPIALIKIRMSPSCVAEVEHRGFQMFVVAPGVVLRMNCRDEMDQIGWLAAIRHAIAESKIDHEDPVFISAEKHADEYETGKNMCTVRYENRADLDIVLARQQQWALVREVGDVAMLSGVLVGSALHSVNGQLVLMKSYSETVSLMQERRAVDLQFRLPLSKKGVLVKAPRSFVAGQGKSLKGALNSKLKAWKSRYFVLEGGQVLYFNNEGQHGSEEPQDRIDLMGTAVSLLKQEDAQRQFCFQLVVGTEKSIVLQAASEEEMLEWASSLYYSIAMANGGSYLVQHGIELLEESVAAKKKQLDGGDDGEEVQAELEAAEVELAAALVARAGDETEETSAAADGHKFEQEDKHDHLIEHSHAVPNKMLAKCYTAVKMVRGERSYSKKHVALPAFMKSQQDAELDDDGTEEMPWHCPVRREDEEAAEDSVDREDETAEDDAAFGEDTSTVAYTASFTAYLVRRQGKKDWNRRVFRMQADHLLEYAREQDVGASGGGARNAFYLEKSAKVLRNVNGSWIEVPVTQTMKEFEATASAQPASSLLVVSTKGSGLLPPPGVLPSPSTPGGTPLGKGMLPPPALPPPPLNGARLPPPKLPPPGSKLATTGDERRAEMNRKKNAKEMKEPAALAPPSMVEEEIIPPPSVAKFYFRVQTGAGVLHVCAQNEPEMFHWVDVINKHIHQTRTATVGVMKVSEGRWANAGAAGMVQRAVLQKGDWQKVHLMLHPDRLCAFKEPEMTGESRWYEEDYELTKRPVVTVISKVEMQGSTENNCFALQREGQNVYFNTDSPRDKQKWVAALIDAVELRPELSDASLLQGSRAGAEIEGGAMQGGLHHGAVKTGFLTKRAVVSEGNWKERFFRLSSSKESICLTYYAEATAVKAKGTFELSPSCLVYPTHMGQFSFALVTAGKVLHVCAASSEDQNAWIVAIQGCIGESELDLKDDYIQQMALQKRFQERFYDVSWDAGLELDFRSEQRRNWAVVTEVPEEQAGQEGQEGQAGLDAITEGEELGGSKGGGAEKKSSWMAGGVQKVASEAALGEHIDSFVQEGSETDEDDFDAGSSFARSAGSKDSFIVQKDKLAKEQSQMKLQIGSAIHAINGKLVALKSYRAVMNTLHHEERPINVTFRRAPEKIGMLTKQPTSIVNGAVKGKVRGQFKQWKQR